MPIYDYMTPYEEEDKVSPEIKASRIEHQKHSSKPSISPGSEHFDVSAAWYNHPGPFVLKTVQGMTPHPAQLRHDQMVNKMTPHQVLSRHDQRNHAMTPHPVLLRHEVPELVHRSSSSSSTCKAEEEITHCPSCGLRSARSVSVSEQHCNICSDIQRERQCPDTQSPDLTDIINARSHEPQAHHHRRHSLFYEPSPHAMPEGEVEEPEQMSTQTTVVQQTTISSGVGSNVIQQEAHPLEQDSTLLEQESTLLQQECAPLEEAHHYEVPYYPGAEEQLSQKAEQEDSTGFDPALNARKPLPVGKIHSTTKIYDNEAEEAPAMDHRKVINELSDESYFYGKFL